MKKEPKFKQGDIVKHVLTGEKIMIIHASEDRACRHNIKCQYNVGIGNYIEGSLCHESEPAFNGSYLVMMEHYSERKFPEWQLEEWEKNHYPTPKEIQKLMRLNKPDPDNDPKLVVEHKGNEE